MTNIMRQSGIKTAADLSRLCGVTQTIIGGYLNLERIPIKKNGGWKESILKISTALKVTPEMLFPEQHIDTALGRNHGEAEISLGYLKQIVGEGSYPSPESLMIEEQTDTLFLSLLDGLTNRQRYIIDRRFGLDGHDAMTQEEIGSDMGLTRNRIRQIEYEALRILRNRQRSKELREQLKCE